MTDSTDPTLIDRVLKRDLLNIQQRVAKGERITSAERALLWQQKKGVKLVEPRTHVSKLIDLARQLGCQTNHISRWMKLEGFPKKDAQSGMFDVLAIQQWLEETGHNAGMDVETRESIEDAKLRKVRSDADLNELKLAELRRELVHIKFVEQAWSQSIIATRQTILAMSWLKDDVKSQILEELRDIPIEEYYRRSIESETEKDEAVKVQVEMQNK